MIDFSHILVPFDGSKSALAALRTAISVAKRVDSKVTAVFVKRNDDTDHLAVADALKAECLKEEIDIVLLTPTGRMYKEVVNTVEDVRAGLIVMGSHGVSGFEEFWIGSNAFRVVSSATVPVITIQENVSGTGFTKIIAPIDQSAETRQKIPALAQIAQSFAADIHLMGATKYTDEESHRTVKRYVVQSKEMLEKEGLKTSVSFKLGDNIAKSTLDCSKEVNADLIIMMSESEPSSGLFMGTNAQQVINRSTMPVITLHPKDVGIVTSAGY